jgi:hypothetical protein
VQFNRLTDRWMDFWETKGDSHKSVVVYVSECVNSQVSNSGGVSGGPDAVFVMKDKRNGRVRMTRLDCWKARGLGQRWLWLEQIADKATQINCDGSSRSASPITTICFPPTSFSPCITQCVLSFSNLFYPVAHNIYLSSLFTFPVPCTAPFGFMRFSLVTPS